MYDLHEDAFMTYMPSDFAHYVTDEDFEQIWNLHPEQYGKVKMAGNVVNTPRWQQSYGESYHFTGMNHEALPIPRCTPLLELKKYVEKEEGKIYKQMLINWYLNGDHYIGKHSDNESQIVPGSNIYSFSFGADRVFRVKSKIKDDPFSVDLAMPHGTLIVMGGSMQKYYTHEVPKSRKVTERRINVTFRRFK